MSNLPAFGAYAAAFEACLEHVIRCSCQKGCPVCVGPSMEVGERGKEGVIKLLGYSLSGLRGVHVPALVDNK